MSRELFPEDVMDRVLRLERIQGVRNYLAVPHCAQYSLNLGKV